MADLRIREAARAVIVTPDRQILLVRFEFETATVWAPPGGGLEPGEDHVDALRRELAEECGLVDVTIGPHVWNRLHVIPFPDGRWDGQRERFHLVVLDEAIPPRPQLTADELRSEHVFELRWVPTDALDDLVVERPASADDDRPTFVRPTGLAHLVAALLDDGVPSSPIDVPV